MKLFFKSLCTGLAVAILFTLMPFEAECRSISDKVLRIHILANSDSEADQTLKLKVRDAILKRSQELFKSARDKEEALSIAQENIDDFVSLAQQIVYDEGYSYRVTGAVKKLNFNTRYYESVTMPGGVYDALQIRIGEAKGKNWWCVMYPSVCLSAASDLSPLENELSDSQFTIVSQSGKYRFRLKFVEVFQSILDRFSQ